MQTICYCALDTDEGRSVLGVLKQNMRLSGSMISRLKREPAGITVNGERVYVTRTLHAGDFVQARCPEETNPAAPVIPATPLQILYEDDFFLVLNKPANISVQTVQDPEEITLETYLTAYLRLAVRPHMVSRLDKGTSGLMTVAKNAYTHELFKHQMHTERYYKEYRAVLAGCPEKRRGEVEAPIGFCEGSTYARCVRPDGAQSFSKYEILAENNGMAFAKLIPVTGRTHQLRVHMAYIGCPLLGDWLYGTRTKTIDRPALHSCYLRLIHPITNSVMEFTVPVPEDMKNAFNSTD